jgi:hypothetical protein
MLTYILDTDIDIVIDLEDFGVPNTVAPVFWSEGRGKSGWWWEYDDTTPEASPVFKEPLVIQGTPAQFGTSRSIALSSDGSIRWVLHPLTTHLAPEVGRASLYQLEGNSANLYSTSLELKTGFELGKCCPEAVHQYWPSVVRTLLMFIRLAQFLDRETEVLLILPGPWIWPIWSLLYRRRLWCLYREWGWHLASCFTRCLWCTTWDRQIYEIGAASKLARSLVLNGNDFSDRPSPYPKTERLLLLSINRIVRSARVFCVRTANWGPSRTNHLATGQGDNLWEIADIGLMVCGCNRSIPAGRCSFRGGTYNSTTSSNTRRSVLHLGRTEAPATVADLFQNDLVILKHVVVWWRSNSAPEPLSH